MTKRKRGTGRVSLDLGVRLHRQLQNGIDGIFCVARRESWTWDRILNERRTRVHEHPDFRRISGSMRAELDAYFRGQHSALYNLGAVRWVHRLDGVEITTDRVSLDATSDEDRLARWKRLKSAHEWAHSGVAFDPRD